MKIFQKKLKNSFTKKNAKINIYRIHASDSIICGYFYIGFIDFMLEGKTLLDYTNLFFCKRIQKE